MLKNNKGITLIALVITIIVLLILAGVSIAMLTGENGILTQAENSKEDTAMAEAADKINMALNGEFTNLLADGELTGGASTTPENIATNNGIEHSDTDADGKYLITVTNASIGNETATDATVLEIKSWDYEKVTGKIVCNNGDYKIERAKYPTELGE